MNNVKEMFVGFLKTNPIYQRISNINTELEEFENITFDFIFKAVLDKSCIYILIKDEMFWVFFNYYEDELEQDLGKEILRGKLTLENTSKSQVLLCEIIKELALKLNKHIHSYISYLECNCNSLYDIKKTIQITDK